MNHSPAIWLYWWNAKRTLDMHKIYLVLAFRMALAVWVCRRWGLRKWHTNPTHAASYFGNDSEEAHVTHVHWGVLVFFILLNEYDDARRVTKFHWKIDVKRSVSIKCYCSMINKYYEGILYDIDIFTFFHYSTNSFRSYVS